MASSISSVSTLPLILGVVKAFSTTVTPSRLAEASLIIDDTWSLLLQEAHYCPLPMFQRMLQELQGKADLLERELGGNRLHPLIKIFKHRRFVNELIDFRREVRTQIRRNKIAACKEADRNNSGPQSETGPQLNEETANLGNSSETSAAAAIPDPTTNINPASELPLYDEPVTVALTLGVAEWNDDSADLIRALVSSTPKSEGRNKNIIVGRRDEHGIVMVHFAGMETALAFENRWNAYPPAGYEEVPAELQGRSAP
ncbi:hypothetical protein C8R43DRAFT_153996 [Mycena crocata]|nr:hypothetical protein C8R43DRAFT_1143730 [Mycena crocata]KAJ7112071.1 hypothetical protein C8R43DRAFT_153996 [Mycena crocata]